MRIVLALSALAAPLALAACNVSNDSNNGQMTLTYNQQQIENAAVDVRDATRDVATGVGNVVTSTGRAIGNEVGDIDVDIHRNRDRGGNQSSGNSQ
jgi:hypothetical protein